MRARRPRARLAPPPRSAFASIIGRALTSRSIDTGDALNAAPTRQDASRGTPKSPLREHVAQSVRRYLRDLNGCDADDVYEIVLREMEIPLFVEVLNHCEGNQSRAAALLGIHRATLRKKLKDYGLA
jgi:Fis family transcriptional regulator